MLLSLVVVRGTANVEMTPWPKTMEETRFQVGIAQFIPSLCTFLVTLKHQNRVPTSQKVLCSHYKDHLVNTLGK
jgi:hypothetical protein